MQQKQAQAKTAQTKKEKEAEEAAAKAAEKAAEEAAAAARAAEAVAHATEAKPEVEETEGTLHKPLAKPGAKKDKPSRKPSATAFQEEAARRRALKLRAATSQAAHGLEADRRAASNGTRMARSTTEVERTRHAGARHARDLGARNDHSGRSRRKMSVKAAEIIKAMMKLGPWSRSIRSSTRKRR